jgi:hypothetical protein
MDTAVTVALIGGIAAIAAAIIQAYGSVSSARHAAKPIPDTKDERQAHKTPQKTIRRGRIDWSFWGISGFIMTWWSGCVFFYDLPNNKLMLGLVILMPLFVVLMVITKMIERILK